MCSPLFQYQVGTGHDRAECKACAAAKSKAFDRSAIPTMVDVIPQIEHAIGSKLGPSYARMMIQEQFPGEGQLRTVQEQWPRFFTFLQAGHGTGLLEDTYKDLGDGDFRVVECLGLSKLAMEASLAVTGLSSECLTLPRLKTLMRNTLTSIKDELKREFTIANPVVDHLNKYVLPLQLHVDQSIAERGHAASTVVADRIQSLVGRLANCADIVDLMDQQDWRDHNVIHQALDASSDGSLDSTTPIGRIFLLLQRQQVLAMRQMQKIHHQVTIESMMEKLKQPPTPSFIKLKQMMPNLPDYEIYRRLMNYHSHFEKALTRVCRPDLHPLVPFPVSLLNLEQMVKEKPGRANKIPPLLSAAITYYATLVQVHYKLYQYIITKVIPLSNAGDAPRVAANFDRYASLNKALTSSIGSDRDRRLKVFTNLSVVNYAYYLGFHPDTREVMIDLPGLRTCLTVRTLAFFGKELPSLFDAPTENGVHHEPHSFTWDYETKEATHGLDHAPGEDGACPCRWQIPQICDWWETAAEDNMAYLEDLDCSTRPGFPVIFERSEVRHARPFPMWHITDRKTLDTTKSEQCSSATGGHAYRRDHGLLDLPAPQTKENVSPSQIGDSEATAAGSTVYAVTNKQIKIVERLLGERGGDVPWDKLLILLRRIGCSIVSMGGTAYHIRMKTQKGRTAIIHRPHPDNKFTSDQAKEVGQQLANAFDLSVDSFVRSSGEGEAE